MKTLKQLSFLFIFLISALFYTTVHADDLNTASASCASTMVIEGTETISDATISKDIYIPRNSTLYLNGNVTVTGNIYVFGTLYNQGTFTFKQTLYCLRFSFASAGNYDYGIVYSYGRISGNSLYVRDDYLSKGIPSITHNPAPEDIVTVPTCTISGKAITKCADCGKVLEEHSLDATGHQFGEWKTLKEASYMNEGIQERICSKCNFTESKNLPKIPQPETEAPEPSKPETPTTEAPTVKPSEPETPATEAPAKPSVPTVKPILKLNISSSIPMQVKKTFSGVKASKILSGDKITKWKSSNTKVATVSSKGKITAKATGKATITATTKKGAKASFKVVVQKSTVATKKLTLNRKTVVLKTKGTSKTFQISVTRNPLTATDKITYKSSNPRVVVVSSKGKLTAKKAGKATITVKCGKKSATLKVTVKK